jgi:hypothetical protein
MRNGHRRLWGRVIPPPQSAGFIFRHSGEGRNPVPPQAEFNNLKTSWTPVFTGVTTQKGIFSHLQGDERRFLQFATHWGFFS